MPGMKLLRSSVIAGMMARGGSQPDAVHKVLAELGFPEVDLEVQKLCSLEGFSCDAHQRLVRLDLSLRDLRGRLPKELGELEALEELDLMGNQLKGEIPKELGQLKKLRELELSKNQLNGPIPHELGQLHLLERLLLGQNELVGEIPSELGQLELLEELTLARNQLEGSIPPELGRLTALEVLDLSQNRLTGPVPEELCELQTLDWLDLSQNQLAGELPASLGQLESLEKLDLSENHFQGPIPADLGHLSSLVMLDLLGNRLSGSIPPELRGLRLLRVLSLAENQLTGEIPWQLSELMNLEVLSLEKNHLVGEIPPQLGQLKSLKLLHLSWNQLVGELPGEISELESLEELALAENQLGGAKSLASFWTLPHLQVLDLSHNSFSGELGWGNQQHEAASRSKSKLRHLDLSHNQFHGSLFGLAEVFCASPVGGVLQELRLNHNDFTGDVPACLMQFRRLTLLTLNNNHLQGSLPDVNATDLVVLALHQNHLSGVLPSLHQLQHLGVLTLHENSIGGSISDLSLSAICMDNSKFRMEGRGCKELKMMKSCQEQVQRIESNCPSWIGCPSTGRANVTLHRNRFSCSVPERLGNVSVIGLVIMGNMLGLGRELNSSWILPEEQQSFLYYSYEVWTSNIYALGGFLLLLFFVLLCHLPQRRRVQETSRNLDVSTTARVVSSNLALLLGFPVGSQRVFRRLLGEDVFRRVELF
eukprot:g10826.t1